MRNRFCFIIAVAIGCLVHFNRPLPAQDKSQELAQYKPATAIQLQFATKAEAAALLSKDDEFVQRLSPFDRSARLKTDESVEKQAYLKFASEQTLDWMDGEKEVITAAWQRVIAGLTGAAIKFPAQVSMIKTTGLEEGDAAYTRGTAIIFPKSKSSGRNLDALVAHELFHVLSRNDHAMRERLYKIIGFHKCGELELPDDLQLRRITNPDAPINDHCIEVKVAGKPLWVVPVLFSRVDKYDKQRGGEFFNYMQFELMAIASPDVSDSRGATQPLRQEGKPVLVDARKAEGFMEKIGKNTGYIIHPDEILADNFSMLITKQKGVPQPELLDRIDQAIKKP